MSDVYKSALEQAQRELAQAIQNRDEWTLEVARLQDLVKSLSATSNRGRKSDAAEAADAVGLQEVVLSAVRMSPKPVSATEVRDYLQAVGYDLRKYSNPLAVIHGALKRLKDRGEITEPFEGTGKYIGPTVPLSALLGNEAGPLKIAAAFRRRNPYGIGEQADDPISHAIRSSKKSLKDLK